MAERLTFTLAGRDELSRVLNGTADSADRLRLRMAGITADADGQLRDLQGRFVSVSDAQRRLDGSTQNTHNRFAGLSDAADKLGEALKANLISLAPAAIPAAAGLAGAAATLAAQFGAVAVAGGVYALALKGQITAIGDTVDAQQKYKDAVTKSGAGSQEAVKAQQAYQQQLAKLPPETQRAAVAVGLLKDRFQDWSDSLSGDVLGPVNKGIAIANTLLPKTTGLVKGASTQFDRLVTLLGGAIATPGFDRLTDRFTDFADRTLDHAVDQLTVFAAKLDSGQLDDSGFQKFLDYAREQGPVVGETLRNVGDALLNVLQAGSDVGVGLLDVINALSGIVSAVPPEGIAVLLQLAIAIKAVKLAAAGGDAARTALAGLGAEITAMRSNAARTPGAIGGVTSAISGLSRTAKLAVVGTGLGLLLVAVTELSKGSRNAAPDMDKLTTSVAEFARTGKASGELARVFGSDLKGLADDLDTVSKSNGALEFFDKLSEGFGLFGKGEIHKAKDEIDALDTALAGLVGQGKGDLAALFLKNQTKALQDQGKSVSELTGQLDSYQNALAGQALEQDLTAQSMGVFGQQAQDVQAKLNAQKLSADGLRQSIVALNEVHRQGLDAQADFEESIDNATAAAQEYGNVWKSNGGTLDLTTDKGRKAYRALSDLASKTNAATTAGLEANDSWDKVNGTFERGRQQLIKNARQMGLNEEAAEALANQILKTPDKTAKLRGDLEDLEKKLADAKARLKRVPDSRKAKVRADISDLQYQINRAKLALGQLKDKTVYIEAHLFVTGSGQARAAVSQSGHGRIFEYATGGLVGFPAGGPVRGPGTGTSDSILARVSNGEYVIPAARVQEYGLALFDAIREGKLGKARPAAPGRPAAPAAAAKVGSDQPLIGSLVVQTGPNANADEIVGAALFQARVARRRGVYA